MILENMLYVVCLFLFKRKINNTISLPFFSRVSSFPLDFFFPLFSFLDSFLPFLFSKRLWMAASYYYKLNALAVIQDADG